MFKILASVIFDDILNIKKEAETIAYCLFLIPYPHQKTFCCKPYLLLIASPQSLPSLPHSGRGNPAPTPSLLHSLTPSLLHSFTPKSPIP